MAVTTSSIEAVANLYVKRADGDANPWTDAQVTQAVKDALDQLWPDFGVLYNADATTTGDQLTAIPAGFGDTWRLSRILVKSGQSGIVSDKATGFLPHPGNFVLIKTRVTAGNVFSFYGFTPYLNDASNLPDRLEGAIAMRAAGFLWGMLAAELTNSELQQNLDSGRVVTQQGALAAAAYFERRFQDATEREPTRISYAPRASNRGR